MSRSNSDGPGNAMLVTLPRKHSALPCILPGPPTMHRAHPGPPTSLLGPADHTALLVALAVLGGKLVEPAHLAVAVLAAHIPHHVPSGGGGGWWYCCRCVSTLLNRKARPVAPVKRVEMSSARLVSVVSQLAQQNRRVPPILANRIACHEEQSNKDNESSLEKTEPAADSGKIKNDFIAAYSNSAGALVDTSNSPTMPHDTSLSTTPINCIELPKVITRLQEMMTLFNPALVTPSVSAETNLYHSDFVQHRDLVDQAQEVSLYLQSHKSIDMERDWKLVLLFVQAGQMCACEEEQTKAVISATIQEVDGTLHLLHSQLKRTIVSVAVWDGEYDSYYNRLVSVAVWDGEYDSYYNRLVSVAVWDGEYDSYYNRLVSVAVWDGEYDSYYNRMCPCFQTKSEARLHRAVLTQVLQESLDNLLVKKGWYGDREDFTVVLQETPLVTDLATTAGGRVRSEVQAARQTDLLFVEMLRSLFQPPVGQPSIEDNEMIITVPCPSEDRPFLRTKGNSPSTRYTDASPLLNPITGTEMPCTDLGPSPSPPTSVHALRPADFKVIAAVGDSLTIFSVQAGNGIASSPSNVLDVLRQYRGLSWSIGGDGNLTTITTLPNILKNFNPHLIGYSVGTGKQDTPESFLNQAVAGDTSKDLPKQVRALVKRMKSDAVSSTFIYLLQCIMLKGYSPYVKTMILHCFNIRINFESDWKVITVFIGGNDACDHCKNSLFFSVDNYLRHVRESLDYLHKEVPRALVNLVEVLHITPLRLVHGNPAVKCPTWLVKILCPCVILPRAGSKALQTLEELNRGYQSSLKDLVESGQYDTHSNFTVVIQPLIRDVSFPMMPVRPKSTSYVPGQGLIMGDLIDLTSVLTASTSARKPRLQWLDPCGITWYNSATASPYIRTYQNSNYTYKGPVPTPAPITNWGSNISCVDISPSALVPTSVHKLRPGDIKVVAALGDSSTAASGAKAKSLFQLNTQYKGVSWSAYSQNISPDILRKFNPNLEGFSKGQFARQKGFNMAVPGAKSSDIPDQVLALIKAMKENKKVDFDNDWKLVTIFVGGNDLCNYCTDQDTLSAKNYSHNLEISLDMLYTQMPRAMVNLVEIVQIDPLRTAKKNDLACSLMQSSGCPCLMNAEENSPELQTIKRINREYQAESRYLISRDLYGGREDFTVVLQPYLRNSFIPYIGVGQADLSFFSVDCFHISEKAHAEMAIALWNNMLEPVGQKQDYNNFTYDRTKVRCPSMAHPFIFTNLNSLQRPPVASTTAVPDTNTTTTASPEPASQCPSSLPVWVPVVGAFASLLIGVLISCLFFSFQQSLKKNNKGVELKRTGL
ncbi:Phospholipase B1, membrane-associated [Merluccius polli]|uniref:Phospholipase B1, membrane-associated n=1 Tax=Merluccius polli TaxID=89951 RepID=A0AA47NDC9_MERPO|nr:Phospholipase B1, membrane-associated [Merluccius polli]